MLQKILAPKLAMLILGMAICSGAAFAQSERSDGQAPPPDSTAAIQSSFKEGFRLASDGQNLAAATIYFNLYTLDGAHQSTALSLLTDTLIRAGYPNTASYFFIKTLQTGAKPAIRRVLTHLPLMLDAVGGDLLRKYILRHTAEADYDAATRNHFFYFLGRDELLKGNASAALEALKKVSSGSGILAQAAFLRGTAYAILGQTDNALSSFKSCERMAGNMESRFRSMRREAEDLESRCVASQARILYEKGKYADADDLYDEIPKASFVWTDILFEQAWNSFAKGDYNRVLGRLVTYRSPALKFVFNPEVDVLRAQAFFALCAYDDVNKTVNEFNSQYANVGGQLKNFLQSYDRDLSQFYVLAKQTRYKKLHTGDMLSRALNRFIRGPYFASIMAEEKATVREMNRLKSSMNKADQENFRSFLEKVQGWRLKSIRLLGGAFVKNSMLDLYQDLLSNLDKMSFIKLGMLSKAKEQIQRRQAMSEDEDGRLKRGGASVDRKSYQYYWSFNGEFWIDELGDYVFALESQCGS